MNGDGTWLEEAVKDAVTVAYQRACENALTSLDLYLGWVWRRFWICILRREQSTSLARDELPSGLDRTLGA